MIAASSPALSGASSMRCAMKRRKSKSGDWAAFLPSMSSATVRFVLRDTEGWKWVVDDRMRDYGETDYQRRVVRINCELHRKHRVSLLDTLLHEELHVQYPFLSERMVCELTSASLPCLTARDKARLYARLRRYKRR
jgi:hypothetical protein